MRRNVLFNQHNGFSASGWHPCILFLIGCLRVFGKHNLKCTRPTMVSPLEHCTAEEQRSVIRFSVAEGVKGSESHERMMKVHGNNRLNRSNVYKWAEQFKSGRPVEVATSSLESCIYAVNSGQQAYYC